MGAELGHDFNGATLSFDRALAFAEQAGDALQEVRIRNARGALEIDRGDVTAAFRTLDQAVRLAEAVGFASFHARALVNRGRAHQGLGRFEEALADFSAAREIYDRVGSPSVAYPLVREGTSTCSAAIRSSRGSRSTPRSAPPAAPATPRRSRPALVGLAQCDRPRRPGPRPRAVGRMRRAGT